MRPDQTEELLAVAAMLGHDPDAVLAGSLLDTDGTLTTLDQARALLSRADELSRERRKATFFDAIRYRQRIGQGVHDRAESIVFAEGELLDIDHAGLRRHFPAQVRLISARTLVVPAGETFDLSNDRNRWGFDPMEETYTIANIGRLVLEPGARLVVWGNVLSLLCQSLHLAAAPAAPAGSDEACHIAILPTVVPVHHRTGGAPGRAGERGAAGVAAPRQQGLLGALASPADGGNDSPGGRDGSPGTAGSGGGRGGRGRNGGMAKVAELTFREIETDVALVVLARGGAGGDGGPGGDGGAGGAGGHGADGGRGLGGPIFGGRGGDGGPGGDGGDGGTPGNGGLASNVYISVPAGWADRVVTIPIAGRPGRPGEPGRPGRGGAGGRGGHPHGRAGQPGPDGRAGRPGRAGLVRTSPAMFVNDVPRPAVSH